MKSVIVIAVFLLSACMASPSVAEDSAPTVTLDTSQATPRQVEDSTVSAVVRDYATAWAQLAKAVEENRSELLDASFVGIARENFAQLVASQQKNGLRQRYVDHGHKVRAIFYSADGSALEVHDTAQIEFQLMDGDKVVGSRTATVNYLAVLTPAESRWKVRVLQSVNEAAGTR